MKKLQLLCSFILAVLILSSNTVSGQMTQNPVSWSSKTKKLDTNQYEIEIIGSMPAQWHVYDLGPYTDGPIATTVTISGNGISTIGKPYIKTKVHKEYDELFGMEIGTAGNGVTIGQKVAVSCNGETTAKIVIEWQTCNNGSCLPPSEAELTVKLTGTAQQNSKPEDTTDQAAASKDSAEQQSDSDNTKEVATNKVVNSNDNNSPDKTINNQKVSSTTQSSEVNKMPIKKKTSLWAIIFEAIAWGFVALLTPCVFPMVPMTVSFFLKNSGDKGKAKGRIMALFYGLSIIALYTLPIAIIILVTYIVGGDAVTADIFNWLATHWIPNIIFFIIFMVFAASFFGAFEITMPSWMINKSDAKSDKGGLIGVFFMALTLVLVSFSCTGPIVSSVLIKSTQGEIWEPIITILAFSTAFALPFTIFAFAPALLKDLPKSGGWLNSVKVVLGFIELALGLKFLSVADQVYQWNILDREIYLALWIVIFSLLGLYLLGKLRFSHDTPEDHISVKRLFLAIITFTFVVYMIPGMWGAPLKALSGYLPPIETLDFNLSRSRADTYVVNEDVPQVKNPHNLKHPDGLHGFFDYQEALEYSKRVQKPLFIDFTGSACVNCREMEAKVLSSDVVKKILNNEYVFLSLYGDVKVEMPEPYWVTLPNGKVLKQMGKINTNIVMTKYQVNAMPYYIITDNNGDEIVPPRGYDLNTDAFITFLKDGIEAYKAR